MKINKICDALVYLSIIIAGMTILIISMLSSNTTVSTPENSKQEFFRKNKNNNEYEDLFFEDRPENYSTNEEN